MNKYVEEFFRMKCAGDVLNAVGPMRRGAKEITEALGLRTAVRGEILSAKMKYHVVDVCAGNGLFGVFTAMTLPVKSVVAYDIRSGEGRHFGTVRGYKYCQADIMKDVLYFNEPTILCAIHACKELGEKIVDLYLENDNIKMLYLMPCCAKKQYKLPTPHMKIVEKICKSDLWVWYLADRAKGTFFQDNAILSPVNKIIVAHKK